ncbi:hypothetical protein IHE45_13G011500 [Dioscorea alata]|uniref:Uncharacterized protein n=1 Tax=Dioscorea alata TaxID=55571 RepID=A0ACB7UWB8_DIOAL|nr:hypothetical protein IHE45_13G011500 [Dioscorea alata]
MRLPQNLCLWLMSHLKLIPSSALHTTLSDTLWIFKTMPLDIVSEFPITICAVGSFGLNCHK